MKDVAEKAVNISATDIRTWISETLGTTPWVLAKEDWR